MGKAKAFRHDDAHVDGQAAAGDRYQTLLAISEAIVSHRDLSSLFHDLADQLRRVARFDYLSLVMHEAASNTMRLHLLETSESIPPGTVIVLQPEEDPAGLVWQAQQRRQRRVRARLSEEMSFWGREVSSKV